MGVYVFVDAYDENEVKILTYKSRGMARTAIAAYMQGTYSIDDEDIEEVVDAIFNSDYGRILCEYRVAV